MYANKRAIFNPKKAQQLELFSPKNYNHSVLYDPEDKSPRLYHGTIIDNMDSIMKIGLVPMIGNFTERFYGEYQDLLRELVFLAREHNLIHAVTAMESQIAEKLGLDSLHEVTIQDVRDNGLLLIVEPDPEIMFEKIEDGRAQSIDRESWYDDEVPVNVEGEDVFSESNIYPKYVLYGSELVRFLLREKMIDYKEFQKLQGFNLSKFLKKI
jgi:hypothetical protein